MGGHWTGERPFQRRNRVTMGPPMPSRGRFRAALGQSRLTAREPVKSFCIPASDLHRTAYRSIPTSNRDSVSRQHS